MKKSLFLSAVCFAPADAAGTTSAPEDTGATPLSKMSVKTLKLNGHKGAALDKVGEVIWLGRIIGRCQAVKLKKRTDDSGNLVEDHPISGFFEGTNLETGEISQSGILYLPGGFHDVLESAIRDANGGVVDFAIEIGAERAENKAKFTWVAKNLMKPAGADQLSALREMAAKSKNASPVKALAAPEKKK